jgi:hypothetical protein
MAKAMNQGVVFRYQCDDVVGFKVGSFDIGGNDCAGCPDDDLLLRWN